jgi:hypothetical protein
MRQLSILLKTGVPKFNIPQLCLPITVHSNSDAPAGLKKYMSNSKFSIYAQALADPAFSHD